MLRSNSRMIHFAIAVLAALLAAPPALADGAYHPEDGEAGAKFYPQHVAANSRDGVSSDLQKAMTQRGWNAASRGAPWPTQNDAPRSREQVQAELQTAMTDPAWDGVSRLGAAWPEAAK